MDGNLPHLIKVIGTPLDSYGRPNPCMLDDQCLPSFAALAELILRHRCKMMRVSSDDKIRRRNPFLQRQRLRDS